jgi:hypothetical protein
MPQEHRNGKQIRSSTRSIPMKRWERDTKRLQGVPLHIHSRMKKNLLEGSQDFPSIGNDEASDRELQ